MVIFGILLLSVVLVSAHGEHQIVTDEGKNSGSMINMMIGFSDSSPDNATIQSQQQEEQEGKNFLDNLNNKTVVCSQLKDADFDKIGEYFMGQSIGDTSRTITMNEMMKSMMGEQGEEQMHILMGKRMSNCEPDAPMPQNMINSRMMPMMMNMMGSGMMENYPAYYDYNSFGNILWSIFLIGVIALIIWFIYRFTKKGKESETPVNILQKRYVRGEINKKQFEEMKKELKE